MSEAAAKATRRNLRRSVGEVALGAITEQGAKLLTVDDRLSSQGDVLKAHTETLVYLIKRDHRVKALTFWQRLRWLLTGSIHGLS